ncbi:TIGR02453 family protein [Shimia sp.]|uniref:TIGR02453 family protein n=1 Tax=Shimia sp. TaxID=1954381 RepID=UPI003298BD06
MSSGFDTLVPDARAFLADLSNNNSRDWFLANKDTYDTALKAPALALLDTVAASLEKQTGQVPGTKLFRPHRDVRFSKDKTPYHTHLHLLWTTPPIGWFFGISGDYVTVGAGAMGFDKNALTAWRASVDGPAGGKITKTLSDLSAKGARISDPELKRVPAPYDKDHPNADLLRRKSLTAWFDLSDADIKKGGLITKIETAFAELLPLGTALHPPV